MMQLTIIGLGTIGGSLGMALRQAIVEEKVDRFLVVGYDDNAKVERDARAGGAIDQGSASLEEAVQQADIVVICLPPQMVGETLQGIAPHLRSGCIVTDTANTKGQVLRWADEFLPPGVSFVGGHPIFAPQQEVDWEAGIKAANPEFFQEAIYCLCPSANASGKAVETINGLVNLIGASPFYLDAMEHDGLLAGVSHVPYVLAAAMLHTMAGSASWRELKLLADPAFRHLSWPLAARSEEFFQACLTNRPAVVSWLDRLIAILHEVRRDVEEKGSTGEVLLAVLEEATAAREDWLERRDERQGEAGSKTMPEIETPGQQIMHMFVPRAWRRRRKGEEGE